MRLHHLFLFFIEFKFVFKHELPISLLLHGPLSVLLGLSLLLLFVVLHLLLPRSHDVFLSIRIETLEMVRHVSVTCQLASSGVGVFRHDVTILRGPDLLVVLPLLVVPPVLLPVSLLPRQLLVLLLHLLHHIRPLIRILIL
jgi:hypothetical protein